MMRGDGVAATIRVKVVVNCMVAFWVVWYIDCDGSNGEFG